MITLVIWHFHYLLSKKTRMFLIGYLSVLSAVFLYLTRFFDPLVDRVIFSELYAQDYTIESFYFLKTAQMILVLFLGLQLWFLNGYDIVLLQRVGRVKLLLSKWLASMTVSTICLGVSVIVMWSFGTLVGVSDSNGFPFDIMVSVWLMVAYHTCALTLLALTINHVSVCFGWLIGFMVGDIVVDPGVAEVSIHGVAYVMHLFFVNVHMLADGKVSFIYSHWYVSGTILGLFVLASMRIFEKDF